MNFNAQIYLFWYLLCSTSAKHLQTLDTLGNQRNQSPPSHSQAFSQPSSTKSSSFSSESNIIPFSNLGGSYDVETKFISPSSLDSGGRDVWATNRQNEHSHLQSELGAGLSERHHVVLRKPSESISDLNELTLKESDLTETQNDLSSNGTQSNETSSTDESSERDSASSGDERITNDNIMVPSSTVTSVDSNSIQKALNAKEGSEKVEDSRSLKRVFLSNRSIVCNDGSQAGFYLRRSVSGSPVWVVFLEGGWYCHDRASCRARWLRLRHLMTSSHWPETRDVNGILSSNPTENPYWHEANHVSIPYCSSDSWSGTAPPNAARDSFHFMGKLIVNQVIRDLVPLGLQNSSWLVLAGSSAGGTGVMLNLDPVQRLLREELGLKKVAVRGISDSGWFLDRTPYSPNTLPAVDAIKKGYALWQGSLPKRCVDLYPQEPWRCYFGYRLYPTIRAPLFVFQWLFDEAQMTADNVGAPVTPQQWDYIHSMGRALRASFANVSAVFAPSCVSHSVLTKKDWLQVKIDDVSVARALRCWELSTMKRPSRNHTIRPARKLVRSGVNGDGGERKGVEGLGERILNRRRKRKKNSLDRPSGSSPNRRRHGGNDDDFAQLSFERKAKQRSPLSPNSNRKTERQRLQNKRRNNNLSNNGRSQNRPSIQKHNNHDYGNIANVPNCSRTQNQRLHPNNRRAMKKCDPYRNERRHSRNRNSFSGKHFRNQLHGNGTNNGDSSATSAELRLMERQLRPQRSLLKNTHGCEHRHIERCSWPQCSHSCPRLLDPYTGEEVSFIDMLKSFGLRMDSVAHALGVDLHTLNNMEHAELLDLLTQQIN